MHNFDPNASSTLGADLRSLRKSRKMTIKELSEATEKSLGWISQIERDKSQPSIDDLRDLARVLNVPLIADVNSVAGIVRAHTHGQKIKQTVSERQRIEPFGPPCPKHLKEYSSIHVENIPRLIPAARFCIAD